jgi:hypothetical protein
MSQELPTSFLVTAVLMNCASTFRTARFFSAVNGTCFGLFRSGSFTVGPFAASWEPGLEKCTPRAISGTATPTATAANVSLRRRRGDSRPLYTTAD